jgi:hypothetical protein
MGSFWQDFRAMPFARFCNSPWFAALAVVTLSSGIAVNTSIFSVVNGFHPKAHAGAPAGATRRPQPQQAGGSSLQKFSLS